jgi:hypothetical protein
MPLWRGQYNFILPLPVPTANKTPSHLRLSPINDTATPNNSDGMILTCVPEIPGSNPVSVTDLVSYLRIFHANVGTVPQLSHCRFLSHPFQVVIQQ